MSQYSKLLESFGGGLAWGSTLVRFLRAHVLDAAVILLSAAGPRRLQYSEFWPDLSTHPSRIRTQCVARRINSQ